MFEGIKSNFPLKGRTQTLYLEDVRTEGNLHPDDLHSQHKAKMEGGSWTVPVYGRLVLKDNATGKVVDDRKMRLVDLPKMTQRHSFIVNGQEVQIDNQWQLKPGVYARRRDNGELEAQFNVTGKRSFKLQFDPASKVFTMQYGKTNLPVLPVMRTLGVDDAELKKAWGPEVYAANENAKFSSTALERFYRADKKTDPPSKEVAATHVFETMMASKLRPDATAVTLGKPADHVSADVLRRATEKMLRVQAGTPEDDRDSLVFKDLRTVGDFAYDRLTNSDFKRTMQLKALRKLNNAKDVHDVFKSDFLQRAIRDTFQGHSAARNATQINPVEMLASAMQTTLMGPGGIQSERSISDEAKFVNPSHLGFLDPIVTPEGDKTGVNLRLPMGLKKDGHVPKIPLYNRETKDIEFLSPAQFVATNVVLPDQVRWENGHPVPLSPAVKMSVEGNEIREGKFTDAKYVMRRPSQMFSVTTNLIPFIGNTQGNRASMAARHMEQAISLVHRDEPLVQVATGATAGPQTFEKLVGRQASHESPVEGHVTSVTKDAIHIKGKDGKSHEVQLYHYFPLNDAKSVMTSTPLVSVGDKVKAGQTVADTNFSRNGTLALGKNVRVAYVPYRGYNFEDSIVISESAAKKLSSEHLYKHELKVEPDLKLSTKAFTLQHPSAFNRDQLKKLGDDGVIQVGQRVAPGDPLIAAMKPFQLKDRTGLAAIRRSLSGSHTDKSLRWDGEVEGEVVGVHRGPDQITVHVRTVEPMQVGDKLSNRHGAKGIVGLVLPDHEMPRTKDGKALDVVLNPAGVTGRMNLGQIYETAASKIAEKTGKPYLVNNFEPHTDTLERIKKELKQHGLSDTEEIYDPISKQSIGHALSGPQHMFKLVHQVDKKLSVRSGMSVPGSAPEKYDLNLQPTSGGGTGGQSMGTLGTYALLAHGAVANLREMQTLKSEGPDPQTNPAKRWPSLHNQAWAAIQTGSPLPAPKPTFAFQKFTDLLRAAGINTEKKGHDLVLTPLTDKQILSMAKHELPNPADLLDTKRDENGDPKPRPGGLFDEKLTGGHGGKNWTRIGLAEPLPNPVFEKPIRVLTGLKSAEYDDIVRGVKAVSPHGSLVDVGSGVTGGAAIEMLLKKIDLEKDLAKSKKSLETAKGPAMDKLLKRVKYLQALSQAGLTPADAYVLHHLPVLPPAMRPVSVMGDGNLKFADVNQLYSQFAQVNDKLKNKDLRKNLTESGRSELRASYYDGVKALMGLGVPYEDAKHKGLLHTIGGSQPKQGFFQNTLINRRQDMTMRSTIVPEPSLGLDQVGIPKGAALDLFRPFVIQKLVQMGAAPTALDAPKVLASKSPVVWKALDHVMAERPVLMKRDPALHKYSVQGFQAVPVEGTAIKIHPLVTGGFNADFDGDTMSIYVPMSQEAVAEARKMTPSHSLFNEATGHVMYQPTLEGALGLFKLSRKGEDKGQKFKHVSEVLESVRHGKTGMTDLVHVGGKPTTAGRVLLASAVPVPLQQKLLHDVDTPLDKKGLSSILSSVAKNHAEDYGETANRLLNLGNGASFGMIAVPRPAFLGHPFTLSGGKLGTAESKDNTVYLPMGTHTLSLKDFEPDRGTRDHVLSVAHKEVNELQKSPSLSAGEKERRTVQIYSEATDKIKKLHEQKAAKDPTNLYLMYRAGIKPSWNQYKQMVVAPMLLQDSSNRIVPTPVTKSYAEGLDIGGYWTAMHGARRGSVMKVQEVREPGYMSKLLMNNMMHMQVSEPDCGTSKGITLPITEHDVHDRYLAADFNHGSLHVPAGTLLSPDVIGQISAVKKDASVVVRSPMKCEHPTGLCQKCAGVGSSGQVPSIGTNVGIQAAHAVGERAVQLTLKSFHTGGAVEQGGGNLLNSFQRFEHLMSMPKKIPDAATLAQVSGKIEKIDKTSTGVDVWVGGKRHHVGKDSRGIALHTALPNADTSWVPKVGMHVNAGDYLSDPTRTFVNPHDLLKATKSIESVQNHLAKEVYGLYKDEGVKRRHVETLVRAMMNLTHVDDAGDHPHVLRGEYKPLSVIRKLNTDLVKEGKRPIEHTPVLKGVEVTPLELQEDWMAKLQHQRLRDTILDAVATAERSHLHGPHPIPGVAYGAEFGLTSAHSKQPGMGHLHNVPQHHY